MDLPIKVINFCNRSSVNDVIRIVYGFKSSENIFWGSGRMIDEGVVVVGTLIGFFRTASNEVVFRLMSEYKVL